jgi:hypothetical protein
MDVVLVWKCKDCNSEQVSSSKVKWGMEVCKCGNSGVDLTDSYQRSFGYVEDIKRTIIE